MQDEVDDLIHDEGEELPDERDLARVYRRVEADQRARDADMSPEELEEYVKRRFERPGFDAGDMGEEQAGSCPLAERQQPCCYIFTNTHPLCPSPPPPSLFRSLIFSVLRVSTGALVCVCVGGGGGCVNFESTGFGYVWSVL
jgi:hypothetical protein